MARWHTAEGIARADLGDGAFVAIDATIMPDLEKQGAVAEAITALDTLGATDAQLFVDGVFVVGIFDVGSLDGRRGAQAILRPGIEVIGLRLKVPGAELAITANRVGVDTFHGGLFQHAVGGTVAVLSNLCDKLRLSLRAAYCGRDGIP